MSVQEDLFLYFLDLLTVFVLDSVSLAVSGHRLDVYFSKQDA